MEKHDKHKPNTPAAHAAIEPESAGSSHADGSAELIDASPDVFQIIADIEQQLERVRTFQQTHDAEVKTLAERAGAIESARAELERAATGLQQREARIEAERARLAEAEAALRVLQEQASHEKAAAAAELAGVTKREQALHSQQEELEAARRTAEEERAEIEARVERAEHNVGDLIQKMESMRSDSEQAATEIKRLQEQVNALTGELAETRGEAEQTVRERDEAGARADDAEQQAQAGRSECESLRASVSEKEAQLSEARRKLDTAGTKLSQFAKVLSEQTEKLERHATALAELDQQRQQIRKLEEQLAASTLASTPEEGERKDRRIAELTEALREARGQSAATPDRAATDQRIADLAGELEASRLEAGQSRLEVSRLTDELRAAREQAASPSGEDARVQACEARIAELEAALARASSAPGDAGSAEKHAQAVDELRRKADRIKAAARHLVLRKDRLRRLRTALQQRPAASAAAAGPSPASIAAAQAEHEKLMRQSAQIQQQREELLQVQAMLAHSEQDMVRKWARPRALTTFAAALVATIILAAASWLAADHFFPARIAASVTLEASARPGNELTAEEAAQWQSWHRALVTNDSFHSALVQRLESRQVPGYAEPALVKARIDHDLKMESSQDDRLTLTLAGHGEAETSAFLDALVATVVAESGRHMGKRSDGAQAVILGERRSAGQVRFASINPEPIIDQRLRYAGVILAGSMLLSFVLVIFIYRKLAQSKRLFDQDDSTLGAHSVDKPVPIR